jgi:hypothetical protein
MRLRTYVITAAADIRTHNCPAGIAGGGWLFVTEIPVAMRIRIGQRGEDAH